MVFPEKKKFYIQQPETDARCGNMFSVNNFEYLFYFY